MQLYKFTQVDNGNVEDTVNEFLTTNHLRWDQIDWKVTSASYTDPMDTDDILHTQHVVWIIVK